VGAHVTGDERDYGMIFFLALDNLPLPIFEVSEHLGHVLLQHQLLVVSFQEGNCPEVVVREILEISVPVILEESTPNNEKVEPKRKEKGDRTNSHRKVT